VEEAITEALGDDESADVVKDEGMVRFQHGRHVEVYITNPRCAAMVDTTAGQLSRRATDLQEVQTGDQRQRVEMER
jgi:hypothetical protein